MLCTFCSRPAPGEYALTRCNDDPDEAGSWQRLTAPVCPRCMHLLRDAGLSGRKLKATGETWYAGHGVGRFEASQNRSA